ncbi:DUF2934 domain-containing protein [Pseudomonas lijiangensis]|uniref:DUF2934 domain-containing protein n=1 Tax=Pseudomonas syringae group TaxID=136849 RepID=UPI00190FE238|nr:DUF2934 domain-containing protein [Pseudomonas cichorii]GFM67950.1 hypothetical protein PSCICJ_40680 [Pseudomonas cichorii]
MSADEKRIREFAYQIWESEGKPVGHEQRHWEMARKLAEAEALAPDKTSASKANKPKLPKVDAAPKTAPSKPAAKAAPAAKPAAAPKPKPAAKPKSTPAQAEQSAKPAAKKPRKPPTT